MTIARTPAYSSQRDPICVSSDSFSGVGRVGASYVGRVLSDPAGEGGSAFAFSSGGTRPTYSGVGRVLSGAAAIARVPSRSRTRDVNSRTVVSSVPTREDNHQIPRPATSS